MKRKTANPSEAVPQPSIERIVLKAIHDDAVIENCLFETDVLENISGRMLDFVGCIFRRVQFSQIDMQRVHFANCRFEQCDLSGLPFKDGTLYRSEFIGCRGTGWLLDRMKIKDVLLKDCQLNYLTVSSCQLERVEFVDCDLTHSMFFESTQKSFSLSGCRLTDTEIQGTPLKDVDLSTCELQGLTLPSDLLRGATVGLDQAPQILGLLGIKVRL